MMSARDLWNRAQESATGIKIITDSPLELLDQLIEERITAGKAELFTFTVQIRNKEVWIVRSTAMAKVRVDGVYKPLEE